MKKNLRQKINGLFDKVVGLYIYGAIIGLIFYMLSSLIIKFMNFIGTFSRAAEVSTEAEKLSIEAIQHSLLHDIAFTIVLVKAYTILMEYGKTKHINLKYVLEIAIIAPIIEIVFNYSSFSNIQLAIFLGFSIVMTSIYLFFYNKLKQVTEDYEKEHKE